MSRPDYVCECHEAFDEDSGASEGVIQCIPCAAWAGDCECQCDCGQCVYTDTPCEKPPSKELCDLCELRLSWQKQFEEVKPILSEVELLVATAKGQLATPWQMGMVSHDYTQKRLDYRLEPCLNALLMIKDKSAWASAVIDEVKNLLSLEGRSGVRKICGISDCTCHLRVLNALVAEKKGAELVALEAQIVAAEDARHAARDACLEAMRAWDATKFSLQVAEEMLEEFKWDTGMILKSEWEAEMRTLNAAVAEARLKATAAGEFYAALPAAIAQPTTEFNRLIELKKGLSA
jgi:hypothetical protein